jgi:hypothetical protein
VRCGEYLLLVGAQGREVGLEAAVAGRCKRVGLGQHAAGPVAEPVAEHHRLGDEPLRAELLCGGQQVVGANGPQPVGGGHVSVPERDLLKRGEFGDDRIGPQPCQRLG